MPSPPRPPSLTCWRLDRPALQSGAWLLFALIASPAWGQFPVAIPEPGYEAVYEERPDIIAVSHWRDAQEALAGDERPTIAVDPRSGFRNPRPAQGLVAGFELAYLKPHGADAYSSLPAVGINTPHGASWDFEAAPRFWLGYTGEDGLGVRARYFQFDHEATTSVARGNRNFQQSVASGLKLEAIDLEVTQASYVGETWINRGAGLRYAQSRLSASVVDNFNFAHHSTASFQGLGPTVFFEATRPIGEGNFALFASARGSLLFGDARQDVSESFPLVTSNFTESWNSSQVVAIGEVQLGGQWQRTTSYGTFFARGAFEGQAWAGAGGYTQPPLEALYGPFFNLGVSHSLAQPGGDIGLVGFTFSIGVSR